MRVTFGTKAFHVLELLFANTFVGEMVSDEVIRIYLLVTVLAEAFGLEVEFAAEGLEMFGF